jgi:hypothetical protein
VIDVLTARPGGRAAGGAREAARRKGRDPVALGQGGHLSPVVQIKARLLSAEFTELMYAPTPSLAKRKFPKNSLGSGSKEHRTRW